MYWQLLFLISIGSSAAKAQDNASMARVDASSRNFPKAVTSSTVEMAGYIQQHFAGNSDRIRAAYRWVTANIDYDKDSMLAINWSKTTEEKIAATLRRRKGVCDNFASVFTDLLLKMNIPAYAVTGYTRGTGSAPNLAHSWSAVHLDGEWFLCDPTWDKDYTFSTNYFLKTPEEFIDTHWPFDPLWQLLPYPATHKEFEQANISTKKNTPYFNVADSLQTYFALDSLQQMEASARRMKAAGLDRETLTTWYAYNQMNIAIIYGEQDMHLYNGAVADLNKANHYLNIFISYRNDFFKPIKSQAHTKDMLQPIEGLIAAAYKKTTTMGIKRENFQYDTGLLKERLTALSKKLDDQNKFVTLYFSTAEREREKLFYQ